MFYLSCIKKISSFCFLLGFTEYINKSEQGVAKGWSAFQHFTSLIPTQGPTLSQARDTCGPAKEKQTQAWTEEEIPLGLSWIEDEVR